MREHASALTTIRESGIMVTTVITRMFTPTILRARSLDEPGVEIPHAGIGEGAAGQPTVLP
jgi:hypothetical protein